MKDQDHLHNIRHSCAHLLAAAVKQLWPNAKNAIGPAIENGFYQDFDMGDVKLSEEDLEKIEKKMRELIKEWEKFEIKEVSVDQAKKDFADNPYKLELIEEFAKQGKKITENNPGNFLDLCKGGHADDPQKEMQHFKLLSIAGAYWRGDEKNKMLTRIYGTAFPTKKELDDYLQMMEEAKKRDHRKLARELDLIVFSDLVGAGLPLYTPKGTILRNAVYNYSRELNTKIGYQETTLPNMNRAELFKVSGHYEKYKDDMFEVKSHYSKEEFFLKPMNCPQHCMVFGSRQRSYRELPIRLSDFSVLYRDEKPGELNGLLRSRAFTQDDGHCFCREDQIGEEFEKVLDTVDEALKTYGFEYWIRLSLRDPEYTEKYLGNDEVWNKAEATLKKLIENKKLPFKEALGEAAIYGPKLDFMATDSIGREWQLSTIQLDMNMAGRFGLEYIDEDGTKKTPVMIHRAIIGSERFIAILIEHYAGAFPTWLAPIQVTLLPIADRHNEFAQKAAQELKNKGIRAEVDTRSERLQAKIRDATLQKVPFMGIIGDKEVADEAISVRKRGGDDLGSTKISSFLQQLQETIDKKI
ncbi:MAG TPA: threonine--tRNA ligase [Methylomirabilota bacterium]|nr:threonine--tRNA ligase [Methylomirabilota bacterium]